MKIMERLEDIFGTRKENIRITPCGRGDVNASYLVEYRNKKCFVKVQKSRELPSLYERQIEREVIGSGLCRREGIPCPTVLAYDYEERYIITEYLNYALLGTIWGGLSREDKKRIKTQAVSAVRAMNRISQGHFGALYPQGEIRQCSEWTDSYRNIVDVALRDCLRYHSLTRQECDVIRKKVDNNCASLKQHSKPNAVFAHLDLHWNNIFIDRETLEWKAVFDFGSSLAVPDYMGFFRLNGGFLYGTEDFYDSETPCPVHMLDCEYRCASLFNTLDYFTFLSYKKGNYEPEKKILLRQEEDQGSLHVHQNFLLRRRGRL